jgi:hypothetical protein
MNFPLFHLLIFGICVTHFVHKAEQVESIEVETLSAEKKNELCSIAGCISFGDHHSSWFT